MKASQMIEQLQALINEHGDLPVVVQDKNKWNSNAELSLGGECTSLTDFCPSGLVKFARLRPTNKFDSNQFVRGS